MREIASKHLWPAAGCRQTPRHPSTFHSILLISIVGALLIGAERYIDTDHNYAPLIAALLASHLLLDLLEGGPIFLFTPGFSSEFGLTYPTTISPGASPTSVGVAQPLPEIQNTGPVNQGAATYRLITGMESSPCWSLQ